MAGNINDLSRYSQDDREKSDLIKGVLREFKPYHLLKCYYCKPSFDMDVSESSMECDDVGEEPHESHPVVLSDVKLSIEDLKVPEPAKYCPECGQQYPNEEVFCPACLVHLKRISDKIDVCDIKSEPKFIFNGQNNYDSFEDLLNKDNLLKINEFDFTIDDYSTVLHDIKSQAFVNFDNLVKENEIDFDELDILEKIILFAKSFVKVEYKSSGSELGYFESDVISIDDRQTDSLQITTLLHELSHFLIQEILIHVLCK